MALLQSQFTIKSAQLKSLHFHFIHLVSKIETCFHKQVTEYLERGTLKRMFGILGTVNKTCILGWNWSQHGSLIISEKQLEQSV